MEITEPRSSNISGESSTGSVKVEELNVELDKSGLTCEEKSDVSLDSNNCSPSGGKLKREHPSQMESQTEESSPKVLKLNCDNNDGSIEEAVNERLTIKDTCEIASTSGRAGRNCGTDEGAPEAAPEQKNSLVISNIPASPDSINETFEEPVAMGSEPRNSSAILNASPPYKRTYKAPNTSASSTSSDDSSDSIVDTITSSISSDSAVENLRFSDDDNNPLGNDSSSDTSSSSSQSSSSSSGSTMELTGMLSSLEEDEDDLDLIFNVHGDTSSSDERHSDDSEKKIPSVLKKTLPCDRFFFPREIMHRQFRSGDSKRRRYSRFDMNVYGSRNMVQRLVLYKSLKKHTGCVNTLSFNQTGNVLISASDDRHVSLWDWSRNKNLLHYDSGHVANVFQAKFLPHSGDTQLITCGQDSQIRISVLDQCGLSSTSLIAKHGRVVHKLAMQPQIPHSFLSAGEDGVVFAIDVRETNSNCQKLLKVVDSSPKLNTIVSLYSIHCNPMKNFEFIVCGNHDEIFLYDQRVISKKKQRPVKTFCMREFRPRSEYDFSRLTITCAVFNYNGTEILGSYSDNDIFLFNTNETKKYAFHYDGHRNFATTKGVNFYGPRSEYVVSGSDCGHIYLWDKKSEAIVQWLKGDKNIVNCLEPHPTYPVLATSGLESDVKVWMPTADKFDPILDRKDFQKVVKKNYRGKVNDLSRGTFGMRNLIHLYSVRDLI